MPNNDGYIARTINALTDDQKLKDTTSNGAKEVYHFYREVNEYGEEVTLNKMIQKVKSNEPLMPHAEATKKASTDFIAYQDAGNTYYNFKEQRDELNAEGKKLVRCK